MARLTWNQTGQNRYEAGVDRGVLYASDGSGVVWNGLVNVEEAYVGNEASSYHFDGVKYLEIASPKNFEATLSAFTVPSQFAVCLGERPMVPGFILTRQTRDRFGFSYRTGIGSSEGYKIHIVYNVLASRVGRRYETTGAETTPEAFSFKIDAVPPKSENFRPSAHFIIDSRKIDVEALSRIEDILYGSESWNAELPSVEELMHLITHWYPVHIFPQSISGLSNLISGEPMDLYTSYVDGIYRSSLGTRLTPTLISGLYELE